MTECLLEFQASERNQAFWKSLVSQSFEWRQKRDDAAKNDHIKTEEKQGRKAQKQVAFVSDTERKYIERPTHWSSVALQELHKSHLSLSCSRRM